MMTLEGAIAQGSYGYVEVDLRVTRDGHIVCLHDCSLKRTLGLALNVDALTLRELYTRVDPARVPTLEAFAAEAAAGKIALMPDVKDVPPQLVKTFEAQVRSTLGKYGLMRSALFIGRPDIIETFADSARIAWRGPLKDFQRLAKANPGITARVFAFNHAWDFTKPEAAVYRAMGMPIVITVNLAHYHKGDPMAQGRRDVGRALALGIDGLQIDSAYLGSVPASAMTSQGRDTITSNR